MRKLAAVAFVLFFAGLALAAFLVGSRRAGPGFPERPVFHVFGSAVTVALPGQKDQVYFRWCDPGTGLLMFANGFSEGSTITAVPDSHCSG